MSPPLCINAVPAADVYFTDFETMFKDAPKEKKNLKWYKLETTKFHILEFRAIGFSSGMHAFPPSITGNPKY